MEDECIDTSCLKVKNTFLAVIQDPAEASASLSHSKSDSDLSRSSSAQHRDGSPLFPLTGGVAASEFLPQGKEHSGSSHGAGHSGAPSSESSKDGLAPQAAHYAEASAPSLQYEGEIPEEHVAYEPALASGTGTTAAAGKANAAKGIQKGDRMPTAGSGNHGIGKCKPCLWLHSAQGCSLQADCQFCHLPHSKQTRTRPSKGKRDSVRRRTAQALAEQAAAQEGSQSKRLIKL
eukprot:gnl/TRDRNA2_/TRDRNA2_173330_c0_seq6.p1 gnl/TRDRNA2_/TRDRNA2_173330_c0~~gnl/TRDRNA2_/TRDRNA2_173330_c0_seq6.p1  ORF type:complete len:233 (+),score=29.24 gnl/TRDRNA2_/TRDRNA2_173330_c0_seq6:101-799(+)